MNQVSVSMIVWSAVVQYRCCSVSVHPLILRLLMQFLLVLRHIVSSHCKIVWVCVCVWMCERWDGFCEDARCHPVGKQRCEMNCSFCKEWIWARRVWSALNKFHALKRNRVERRARFVFHHSLRDVEWRNLSFVSSERFGEKKAERHADRLFLPGFLFQTAVRFRWIFHLTLTHWNTETYWLCVDSHSLFQPNITWADTGLQMILCYDCGDFFIRHSLL